MFKGNLFVQFSVISFVVMAALGTVLAIVLSNSVKTSTLNSVIDEAATGVSGRVLSFLKPADLETPMTGDRYLAFDDFVKNTIVSDRIARVKLWGKDRTVIYSNDPQSVGEKFSDNEHLLIALDGRNAGEIKLPNDPENENERFLGTLIEVYTPLKFEGASAPQGVLEIYQYYMPTAQLIARLQRDVWLLVSLGFVSMYGTLVAGVWRGWQTILRQKREREEAEKEKANMLQQLILSDKLASIGQMTSGIAHELNNPLSSVVGFSEHSMSLFNWHHKYMKINPICGATSVIKKSSRRHERRFGNNPQRGETLRRNSERFTQLRPERP